MNNKIPRTYSLKNLGVTFDDKLNFNVKLEIITTDARKLIGYILNQWRNINRISVFILLYNVLGRSTKEYDVGI